MAVGIESEEKPDPPLRSIRPQRPAWFGQAGPQGLDAGEAARRLAAEGPNLLPGSEPKSTVAIVREVLTEPMFLMLLAGGAIYFALGDRTEALFLLSFVAMVIGISLAQERKTQRALESLRDLSAPRALVLRNGTEQRIAGQDVVRGDWLVLHEGDRIAADAVLVRGEVEVDESLLTGEAVPVSRTTPTGQDGAAGDAGATLHASTVVTRGVAIAEVVATGAKTAVGRIGADLNRTVEPPSALQQGSRKLVRRMGALALVLAVAQVLLGWWWNGRPLLESLLSGIALAMAVLPEEIPLVLTVFLALGAWRISRQQVLTRRVSAVEALGAITVLAVDKTGTLTVNRMAVAELVAASMHFRAEGSTELPEAFHTVTEFAMLATPGDPFDPMEKAIQRFGHHWLSGTEHVHDGHEPETEYPLSGEILAMTRVFATADPTHHLLATKGAPEAVADLCHLDALGRANIRVQVDAMAVRGLRVLGVARGRWAGAAPAMDGLNGAAAWPASQHDFDFEFLGLVGLADPPRPEVSAALGAARRAGVRVIMMTGDHPTTARAIAQQVGLSERPEMLTGADVDVLNDVDMRERLRHVDLCARLKPEHKLRLVQLLRAQGEVVAMTGDGVNDAPALKAADVGIAMGQRGTDVAREAAALVLLDDSFTRILEAIRQGRRIDGNIRKAIGFIFAIHIPIITLALVPPLLHWPVLLLPVHIVLLELLIDPACSIVFEAEPPDADVMERPPRPVSDSPFALSQLMPSVLQGLGVACVLLAGHVWMLGREWSELAARSVVFGALLAGVLLLIFAHRDRSQPVWLNAMGDNAVLWRMQAGVGVLLVAVLGMPLLNELLKLSWPSAQGWGAMAALLVLSTAWVELLRRVTIQGAAP